MSVTQLLASGSGVSTVVPTSLSSGGANLFGGLTPYAIVALIAISSAQSTGSMGAGLPSSLEEWGRTGLSVTTRETRQRRLRRVRSAGRSAVSANTAEQLGTLRRRLSLTMQQLADIIGVTRPVIYRWADGTAQPRQRFLERIAELSSLADGFAAAGGTTIGLALTIPQNGEVPLLALLKRDKLPVAAIRHLLCGIAQRQERIGPRSSIGKTLEHVGITAGNADRQTADREDAQINLRDRSHAE